MPASAPAADIHVGGLACRGKFSHPRSGGVQCVRALVLDGQRNTKHTSTPDATAATQSDKTSAEAMPLPASLCAVLAVRNKDVRAGVLTPQIRPLSKYHETVASGVEEIGHGTFVHELGWERVSRPREPSRFTTTVHHPPVMHHLLACLRTLCYLRTGRVSVA